MRNEMTGLDLYDDAGEPREHWLNRSDARAVANVIALSESWPRRWLVSLLAAMFGISRGADRLFCMLEDQRENRPASPNALRYLKERTSSEVFERIMRIYQIDVETGKRAGRQSGFAALMTIEPILIELGAGFRATDAVHSGQRRAAKREARADLAARQRQALDGK